MKKNGTKKTGARGKRKNDGALEIAGRTRRSAFWRKYMRLTRAGVLSLRALEIMRQEEDDVRFAAIVASILHRMEGGSSMSIALTAHPSEFSISEVEMIKTAEKRGAWDEILLELADGLADGSFKLPSHCH